MPSRPTHTEERRQLHAWTGRRIHDARVAAGYTQAELAHALGFRSGQWVSDIELGRLSIDAHELRRLATLLQYPIDYFLDPDWDERRPEAPRTIPEWQRLYPNNPKLARLLASVSREYSETDDGLQMQQNGRVRKLGGSSNGEFTYGYQELLEAAGY